VSSDRIRKPTEENKELARTLRREFDQQTKKTAVKPTTGSKKRGLDDDDSRASEDRQNSLPATGRNKRGREDLDRVCINV
jgi:hypothetical protein